MPTESVDHEHSRPDGAPDELVAAVGTLSEALERIERARGALYEFHQLMGGADAMLDDGYYTAFRELESTVRQETMAGRRHVVEAEMKQRRRTRGGDGHDATPG